ncbi:MaoC family dehydratase [Lawsonibacter hominis]|uniref:MaoC family dehydratase n=1 Tax=Lawsonibacter hominis TaxID=2763053 RepID=UPI003326472F
MSPKINITIGQSACFTKTITESDVYTFAGISGDLNPAHINEEYAKTTRFGGRIAHGMLSAGLISAVIGMQLPGPGTIYMGQELKFLSPVRIGDTVTARVQVASIDEKRRQAVLETTCTNQDNALLISGQAKVLLP